MHSLRSGVASEKRLARLEAAHDRTVAEMRAEVERLEHLIEGLQDAMHRESMRHDEQNEIVQKRLDPVELTRALSDDARRRGL